MGEKRAMKNLNPHGEPSAIAGYMQRERNIIDSKRKKEASGHLRQER